MPLQMQDVKKIVEKNVFSDS
jgi:hypothetical protein